MPLSFDDLIPQGTAPPISAPKPSGGLSFDDLIPQKETAPTAPAMSGEAPVPTTLETFFQNLPQYPGALASRFTDLAKGATTGQILPQSENMPGGERQGDIPAVLSAATMGLPVADIAGPLTPRVPVPFKGPTETALEASKTARYGSPEVTGLQLKPEAGEDLSNIIKTDLKAAKLDQFNAPEHYQVADRLREPRFGDNLTIADLDAARQDAKVEPIANSNAKRASEVVRKAIDNYIGNIPENHVLSGNAAAANDALLKARGDTAALKRSEEITNALGRAQNRTPAAGSGQSRFDNLTRQQLVPILDKKAGVAKVPGFEDYTPPELDALRNAIDPGWLQNKARSVAKAYGGSGGLSHGVSFYGPMITAHEMGADPYTAFGIGLGVTNAAKLAGKFADKLAYGRVNYLGDLLRQRSPLANEMQAMGPQMTSASWPQWLRFAPMLGLQGAGQ